MKEKSITRIAVKDLHKIKSLTDWKRVDALTDEDIEKAVAEDPDTWIPTKEEWASARIVWPEGKEPIAIRLDRDIVQWFGDRSLDYRAKINAVLREYVEAQKPPRKRTARSASVVTKKHPRKAPARAAVKS
jgi:uncharacterized protein (DUF4415 family)